MPTPTASASRNFPRRLLTLAALASLTLSVVSGLWVMRHGHEDRALFERTQSAQYLAAELMRCDEALRLTAHWAAFSGAGPWGQQYQRLEMRAAVLLTDAAQASPDFFRLIPTRHLTRIERQILELSRLGKTNDAQRLLMGEEYDYMKQLYSLSWRRVSQNLDYRAELALSEHQQDTFGAGGILFLGGLAQAILWLLVIRYVRNYIAQSTARETALRESEELNRTLLASLPQRVFYKDRRLVYRGVNAALAAELGMKPEDVVGRTDAELYPAEIAQKQLADDRQVMFERKIITLEERVIERGQERFLEIIKAPVLDQEGRLIGLVGLSADITARKQAETKLRDYARRLTQNNRELQEFAYVASHDLQEPLRKVRAFGDRLMARSGKRIGPESRDYLLRMQNAAERMQSLIEALLNYSRITTLAKPFETVKLDRIVREVMADLEIRIEQTHARFQIGPLPEIQADATQMRQLFQNLIGNALKFHRPEQPPEIIISAEVFTGSTGPASGIVPSQIAEHPPDTRYCQLQVRDNGIGFDEKYANRIFGVFQRLHGRSEYEGAGVGLAICRKIALRHGGDITARSRPGEGAVFYITLPVSPQPAAD